MSTPLATIPLVHRASVGTRGPLSWGAGSPPNGLARDLRPDEALGPVFTGAPLEAPLEILGNATVDLAVEAGSAVATAVVRLSDVAPDGTPIQVAAGVLNLTHRRSHAHPEPLVPGDVAEVRIQLRAAGHRFLPGHRIRLSIATSAWPVLWPSPDPATHLLLVGGTPAEAARSRLTLPTVPSGDGPLPVPGFRLDPPLLDTVGGGEDEPSTWRVVEDVIDGRVTVEAFEGGETILENGARLYSSEGHTFSVRDPDPAGARMTSEVRYRLVRDGVEIEVDADTVIAATETTFEVSLDRRVRLDGAPFEERSWRESIPRDLA